MIGITNVVNKRKSEAERMNLTLKTNQSEHTDLLGVNFTLTYGTYTKSYTWNGSTLTIEVPNGVEYTLTFPDVEGYACNTKSVTYTAQSGNSRMLEVLYQCELLTVNVSADNGTPTGFEVTIGERELIGESIKYTRLNYVESSGTQYINTGCVISGNKARIVCDFEFSSLKDGVALFGSQTTSGTPYMVAYYAGGVLKFYCGNSSGILPISGLTIGKRMLLDMNMNNGTLEITLDGVKRTSSYSGTIYSSAPVFLFGNSHSGTPKQLSCIKLYSCEIYDNDKLVRKYTPVSSDEREVGLYDEAFNKLYTNSGSETIIGGQPIGKTIAIQTAISGSYKIPFGISYYVSSSKISGYETTDSFYGMADGTRNIVNLIYKKCIGMSEPTNGIWIESTDGFYYTIDDWDLVEKTANGIAVVTDNCRFVMALDNTSNKGYNWGGYGILLSGVYTASSFAIAKNDYNGKYNTDAITSALGTSIEYAAIMAKSYKFPNGMSGYLGSLGEWNEAINNKTAIISALSKCKGVSLPVITWSSVQRNESTVYAVSWSKGRFDVVSKNSEFYVRAFTSLKN